MNAPQSNEQGVDFDKDLARLEQIRRAHKSARPTHENPAWLNTHGDLGFALGFIDDLWRTYTNEMRKLDRLTRERAIVNAAVTGNIANAPPVVEALQQFIQQWNVCGPNSDFGRYFGNIRDTAVAALAKHQGMEDPLAALEKTP